MSAQIQVGSRNNASLTRGDRMTERTVLPGDPFAPNGIVNSPVCCGEEMDDDGGCSEGCCDDFKCKRCGKRIRLEYS